MKSNKLIKILNGECYYSFWANWDYEDSIEAWEKDRDIKKCLNVAMQTLTPREQKVIKLRFELDGNNFISFRQIAYLFEVSNSKAVEIKNKALRKLGHPCRGLHILKEYL